MQSMYIDQMIDPFPNCLNDCIFKTIKTPRIWFAYR